jgi:flavin reductase (DIM6/NTAB) family NADH-FMN oxidoreductase RutF
MNLNDFRAICGQFVTGITVITTSHNNQPFGFTANSFTSVSLEPPIVLFCLKTESTTNEAFRKSNVFAINILAENQEDISNAFANPKNTQEERFSSVELIANKLPILKDSLGYLAGKIIQFHEVGDHIVYYGQVNDGKLFEGNPLLYAKGGYQRLP